MEQMEQKVNSLGQWAHLADWGPRLAVAAVFLYHGLTKFPNLSATAGMMGLPVAVFALVALAETSGGALLLAGKFMNKATFTRLGGLAIIPPMLGAILMVHMGQWSFVPSDTHPMGGMEFQVLLLAMGVYYALKGND